MSAPLLSPRRLSRLPPRSAAPPASEPRASEAAVPAATPSRPYCLAQRSRLPGPDLNALIARQQQLYDELTASGELPRPTASQWIHAASAADLTRELAGWTPPLPGNCYPHRAAAAAYSSATDSPRV